MPPKNRASRNRAQTRGQRPPPRTSGSPRKAAQPAPAGRSIYPPAGSTFRHYVERVSAPLLVMLTRAPRYVVAFAPLVLLLLGLFLPLTIGLVVLGIFLLLTGWLAYLSWPKADARARFIRVLMFALVVALIVLRLARA